MPTIDAAPAPVQDWLPVLELATREVFSILLGCNVEILPDAGSGTPGGLTAVVGLAGALCGTVTVGCTADTASRIAQGMLGESSVSAEQLADALGEMCNLIAGNFKNKLSGTDELCMLSVPSVISGREYRFHSLAEGSSTHTTVGFEGAPIAIRLHLKG